jgi:hypothetical protein
MDSPRSRRSFSTSSIVSAITPCSELTRPKGAGASSTVTLAAGARSDGTVLRPGDMTALTILSRCNPRMSMPHGIMSRKVADDNLAVVMRRLSTSSIASFAALSALGCAMTVPAVSTQAYTVKPGEGCGLAMEALEAATERGLAPSNGEEVPASMPLTLSAPSTGQSLIFSIASSPALLSTPDIDSGLGSLRPGASEYTFSSTKATATPRTIYWDTSFTVTPEDCEGPRTFTTHVRSLVVVSSPASEEQAAADGQHGAETSATGVVSPDGLTIDVRSNREAAIRLACTGAATCSGKLTLTTRDMTGANKKAQTKARTIATGAFSIAAGKAASIKLALNKHGRTLLNAVRGRLGAMLTIVKTSPLPSETQTHGIVLERRNGAQAARSGSSRRVCRLGLAAAPTSELRGLLLQERSTRISVVERLPAWLRR